MQTQVQATESGLQYLQITARKIALDRLNEEKKQQLARAVEEANQGKSVLAS